MGYIPALIVMFSGGFLWGIVVYNSLKTKKEALQHKMDKIASIAAERNRVIHAILNESSPSEIGDIIDDPFLKVQSIKYNSDENFLEEESKAKIWINSLIQQLKSNEEKKESVSNLLSLAKEVDKHLWEFARIGKSYNNLVSSKPTSFMASTLNFKPIKI